MIKCSLVILIILLVNMEMVYSANATEVKILFPKNGAEIANSYIDPINVTVFARDVPTGQDLWIFLYPLNAKKFYPQDKRSHPLIAIAKEKMYESVYIGTEIDQDVDYKLFAVVADQSANLYILNYLDKSIESETWLGLKEIPDGAGIYDSVMITVKKKEAKSQCSIL